MAQPNPPKKPLSAQKKAATPQQTEPKQAAGKRILKKYPNRRLYDSLNSSYITLSDVKRMVLQAEDFLVVDAKTHEDITRSILLQIILEEESDGIPMFSRVMLENIIRFYGHAMQSLMGNYLEKNLLAFIEMQSKLASQSASFYENKAFTPEVWAQFMSQAPMMQGLMGNYLDQARQFFTQMQEQMNANTGVLFNSLKNKTPDASN